MKVELIVVLLLFAGALFYISKRIYVSIRSKKCGTDNCSGCVTVSTSKIKVPTSTKK